MSANWCSAADVSTDRTCGVCGVRATPHTVGRWFIDEDTAWNRCDLHHPYNGDPETLQDGWTGCVVNGVTYALHTACQTAFIVPQEHDCRAPRPTQETDPR